MGGPHPKDYRDTIHLLRRGSAVPKDNNTEVPPPKEVANPVPSFWAQSVRSHQIWCLADNAAATEFSLERFSTSSVLHLTREDGMEPAGISQPCPRCGSKLQFRHTVESLWTGLPVDFFRCKDCGCVHTVERRTTGALSSDPLPAPEAAAKRKRA